MNKWQKREFLDKLWLGFWVAVAVLAALAIASSFMQAAWSQ